MSRRIESPTKEDLRRIVEQAVHADELVHAVRGRNLSSAESDLQLLQEVLDSKLVEPESTYSLQALGIAFGQVFIKNNRHYGWSMVEDDHGRDPAIRYKQTTLLVFPQTMLSKRIEDGEEVQVAELYSDLQDDLETIRRENYSDD